MKGWQIFVHSMRQVFGNLRAAILLSALPGAIALILLYAMKLQFTLVPFQLSLAIERGLMPWGRVAIFLACSHLLFVWLAVNRHRHILREESAGSGLPPLHCSEIWAYLLATLFLIIAIILPVSFAQGFIAGLIGAFISDRESLLPIIIAGVIAIPPILLLSTVALRAGIYLPARALGQSTTLRNGWDASKGQRWPFIVLFLLLLITFVLLAATLKIKALYPSTTLGLIWSLLCIWLKTILSLSVLTTLYGHYIEKRPLV